MYKSFGQSIFQSSMRNNSSLSPRTKLAWYYTPGRGVLCMYNNTCSHLYKCSENTYQFLVKCSMNSGISSPRLIKCRRCRTLSPTFSVVQTSEISCLLLAIFSSIAERGRPVAGMVVRLAPFSRPSVITRSHKRAHGEGGGEWSNLRHDQWVVFCHRPDVSQGVEKGANRTIFSRHFLLSF